MSWFFAFFFVSGFCSILYELVWLRLAMAQFGVTTALVSIVLSVFMGGLGAGSQPETAQDKDQAAEGHLHIVCKPSADGEDSNLLPVTKALGFRGPPLPRKEVGQNFEFAVIIE
jgi:hypothetical protein